MQCPSLLLPQPLSRQRIRPNIGTLTEADIHHSDDHQTLEGEAGINVKSAHNQSVPGVDVLYSGMYIEEIA